MNKNIDLTEILENCPKGFEYEGIKLEVVKTETYSCSGCYFINLGNKCYQQVCMCSKREDRNNVIFQFVGFIE